MFIKNERMCPGSLYGRFSKPNMMPSNTNLAANLNNVSQGESLSDSLLRFYIGLNLISDQVTCFSTLKGTLEKGGAAKPHPLANNPCLIIEGQVILHPTSDAIRRG